MGEVAQKVEVNPAPLDCDPFFKIRQWGLIPASQNPVARGRAGADRRYNREVREEVGFGRGMVTLLLVAPVDIRGGGGGGAEEK